MVVHICNPRIHGAEQQDHKFKVSLDLQKDSVKGRNKKRKNKRKEERKVEKRIKGGKEERKQRDREEGS